MLRLKRHHAVCAAVLDQVSLLLQMAAGVAACAAPSTCVAPMHDAFAP